MKFASLIAFVFATLVLAPASFAQEEAAPPDLRDIFAGFAGEWKGSYEVRSSVSEYSETFLVEQSYWWDGDVLRSKAVYSRDGAKQEATARTYLFEGTVMTEVSRGDATESFIGVPQENGIVWISTDLSRAEAMQIMEWVEESEDGPVLKLKGFDTYDYQGEPAFLLFDALLEPTE